MSKSRNCITQTCSNLLCLLDLSPKENMAKPMEEVLEQSKKEFLEEGCDRIFVYNPDAIALWIYEKYKEYFSELEKRATLALELDSVFPPVTPACFGSMYTGLSPSEHGIQKYEKYVLKVNTIFDQLVAAGKKVAIVSTENDSISILFLEREIDYFIYKTVDECNSKAMELIDNDEYDVIVLYNGNYDYRMHRNTPTGKRALGELKKNIETYCEIFDEIEKKWKSHNSCVLFAPDHGCHRFLGFLGNHGKNEPCDMLTKHFYGFVRRANK